MQDKANEVRRTAVERGLTSYMNDTKWRETCEAFRRFSDPPPRFRVVDLMSPDGRASAWDGEWYYHPRPYASIRMLEVELQPGAVARAVAMCKQVGAAVEVAGAGVRIWGWVGATDHPAFA
jgi:hypothetical protein